MSSKYSRALVDCGGTGLLILVAVLARFLPRFLLRPLVSGIGAAVATLMWPFGSLRARARAAHLPVRPATRGWALGGVLLDLVGCPRRLSIEDAGLREGPERFGLVVLGAHLGPWEAGARELARRGLKPLVVAAPWPRLPRTERTVRWLRGRHGVQSVARSPAGWRKATRHLRGGGAVVVLVDSASAKRRGRRPVPWVEGEIGAPDAVIAWALRNRAELWTAVGEGRGYRLRRLPAGPVVELLSDRVVSDLRSGVRRSPSHWAWVRALAAVALLVGTPLAACTTPAPIPPLPIDPEGWVAEAAGAEWTGSLAIAPRAVLQARTARFSVDGGGANGFFEGLDLHLYGETGMEPWGHVWSKEARGSWPDGPLHLTLVGWEVQAGDELLRGSKKTVEWDEGFRCGGCPLEGVGALASKALALEPGAEGGGVAPQALASEAKADEVPQP